MATRFGPSGEAVYNRSYRMKNPDGSNETWADTVERVVNGNIALVHGKDSSEWSKRTQHEAGRLKYFMNEMAILPAGRQLRTLGMEGRQFAFNCHHSGWSGKLSDHFKFTFMRLVEGGGVGANYSTKYFDHYGSPMNHIDLRLSCDTDHPDFGKMPVYVTDEIVSMYPVRVEDTREGWADALGSVIDAAMSRSWPNGIRVEFELSDIRPEGSPLVSSGGTAAGPAPLAVMLKEVTDVLNRAHEDGFFTPIDMMEIDHAISVGAIAGGNRRSARMSMVNWNDPYIFEFIDSKADGTKHWTTNISVAIDDEFISMLERNDNNRAKYVHKRVCEAVLNNGEPGYWNMSLSNVGEVDEIICTNPCGEIPLAQWEACNLGHVNMDWFARTGEVDVDELFEAHRLITRFLIRSTYSDINDPKQREIQDRNRRIGVGHLGVQGFWAKQGVRYSEIPHVSDVYHLTADLADEVRTEAREYAFKLRIPEPIKVTTVAPTGSVAKLPGVSEGIHPIYARHFERRIRFSKRSDEEFSQVLDYMNQGFTIEDDVYDPSGMTSVVVFPTEDILVQQVRDLGIDESVVESSDELTVRQMLDVQAFYQNVWADNAVSYTVNIPDGTVSVDELQDLLVDYLPKLKGTTIMVDATRDQAPYTRITKEDYQVAEAKRVDDSYDEACATGACPI